MIDYGYADIGKLADFANNSTVGLTANDIIRFPKADVQPVKRGYWEEISLCEECGEWSETVYKCSICKETEYFATKFCPNCGADMRGDTDDQP